MSRLNIRGFSVVELSIIVVVVVGIAFAGFSVMRHHNHDKSADHASVSEQTKVTNVASAPSVANKADLETASSVLDDTDLDKSNSDDLGQLEADLNSF